MKEEKLNGILKIIEGMPKYEWDRIAQHHLIQIDLPIRQVNKHKRFS